MSHVPLTLKLRQSPIIVVGMLQTSDTIQIHTCIYVCIYIYIHTHNMYYKESRTVFLETIDSLTVLFCCARPNMELQPSPTVSAFRSATPKAWCQRNRRNLKESEVLISRSPSYSLGNLEHSKDPFVTCERLQ